MECHLASQRCGEAFQYGHFKELFLPTLGNIDYGEYDHNEKGSGTMKVLNKNEKVITLHCFLEYFLKFRSLQFVNY